MSARIEEAAHPERTATRILFVDDEPNVLRGLQRMLRGKRHEWAMEFVDGGAAALACLDAGPCDIVVSDLIMPGMDGVQLLEEVRKRKPSTVRIALSGYADRKTTLRAAAHIHQFLAKPCEPDGLKSALERAVRLRGLLGDTRLRELVASMEALPSIDALHDEVMHAVELPETSAGDVGRLIARDPGMSAKVLQLANSALFSLPQLVSSPVQATVLLGLETIRMLALSVRIFEAFSQEALSGLDEAALWRHSLTVARLSKRLALEAGADEFTAECAHLAGLFHDVGKLVLAANLPAKYRSVARLGGTDSALSVRLEHKFIGANHGEIGAYLLGLWGFAEETIQAIARHHVPGDSPECEFTPLTAVHVANVLVNQAAGIADAEFDAAYLERAAPRGNISHWEAMCREALERQVEIEL